MLLGATLVEAKLTEKDFTSKPKANVSSYAALRDVFDVNLLPADEDNFQGYQLIRNVLAADQHGKRLIVLLDSRRPDLLEHWWRVHAAISAGELRKRCGVRFWQQLAAAADPQHRDLLLQKYGI
jgi:aryl carrier-like protein